MTANDMKAQRKMEDLSVKRRSMYPKSSSVGAAYLQVLSDTPRPRPRPWS